MQLCFIICNILFAIIRRVLQFDNLNFVVSLDFHRDYIMQKAITPDHIHMPRAIRATGRKEENKHDKDFNRR
jgi:hypothetical protein